MPAPTQPAPSYSKCYALKEIIYGFWATKVTYTPDKYPDLTGKTAVVTGCNTGVGKEAAKLLYQKNCNVIGVCRTESKGLEAAESIKQEIGNSKGSISVVSGCDFLDFTTVPQAGKRIQEILAGKPLNIIIHNAGLMSSSNAGTSKQGLEAMFQTNVMGPQLLQHYLDPVFLKEDDTSLKRIVWVSSGAHLLGPSQYGIFWENPGFDGVAIEKRPAATTLYGATKAANILQAKAWATRNKEMVDKIGCVSVSCYRATSEPTCRETGTHGHAPPSAACSTQLNTVPTQNYTACSPIANHKRPRQVHLPVRPGTRTKRRRQGRPAKRNRPGSLGLDRIRDQRIH
ncbi:short chain dehydrogenase [Nakaseomyces glabratus]